MSTGAYLIPSGFKEGTNLFVRAMSWGASDTGYGASLPSGSHQMCLINEGNPVYWPVKAVYTSPTLNNGGFETAGAGFPDVLGTWSEDWDGSLNTGTSTGYLDTSDVYAGSSSLRINFNGGGNENWVRLWKSYLSIGETGRMTFYAKTNGSGSGINVRNIRYGDGHTGVTVSATNWQKYSFTWEQTSDSSTGPLMIPSASGEVLWLDNLVIESRDVPKYYETLISPEVYNGGFEETGAGGFEYWTEGASASSTVNRDTSDSYSGSASLRFDLDGGGNYAYARLDSLPLISGRPFTLTYYAKSTNGAGLQWDSELGGGHYNSVNLTSGWQQYSFSETGSGHRIRVARKAGSAGNSSIWVDNIVVKVERSGNYDSFENLGTISNDTLNTNRGYLATFLKPQYESGFYISERWKYDTFTTGDSGSACASGLLSKLQEQPQGTLLVLSTNDEPAENADIFKAELENNWGAEYIKHVAATGTAELENGPNGNPKFRSSYILIASKGQKKIYEDYANSGEGPVGFCGWIKNKAYETGIWYQEITGYLSSGVPDTGYAKDSIDWGSYGENQTVSAGGFFKTTSAGSYIFRVASDDASYMWLGDKSASGWNTGNAEISLGGFHAAQTGYYTGELEANTYYPIRFQYGNGVGTGEFRVYYRYENDAFSPYLPYYHINYQTGLNYYPENIGFASKYYQNMDALFSLYDLTNTNPDIVEVRREIDDATSIFKAPDILDGTLTGWVVSGYLYESDFSVGSDSVIILRGTVTGNVDGIGGYDDVLKHVSNDSDLFHGFAHPNSTLVIGGNVVSGETYRIRCEVFVESGNNAIVGATIYKPSSPFNHPDAFVSGTEQWLQIDYTFTADASYRPYIVGAQSNGNGHGMPTGVGGVSGDVFYAKNYTIEWLSKGYVKTWYNLTDETKNATQNSTGLQPMIVTGGNQVYDTSGNPSILFSGDHLKTSIIPPNNLSAITVVDPTSSNGMIFGARDSTNQRSYLFFNSSSRWQWGFGASFDDDTISQYPDLGMLSMYHNTGSGINVYRNSSGYLSGTTTGLPNCTTQGYYIGAWNDAGTTSLPYNGYISMLGLWSADQGAREIIENEIKNVYNI